jgi:hypothetical protein
MEKYFTKIKGVEMNRLQISDIGKYSVSRPSETAEISRIIMNYFSNEPKSVSITDATANNGGNTVRFAMDFKYVNSVEIARAQFNILKNNVEVYKFENVKLIHSDYLRVMNMLTQDVIFIDAPWGGPEYKLAKNVDLYLSRRNLVNIVSEIIQDHLCRLCVLKVPNNYNFSRMFSNIPNIKFDIYPINVFTIICIQIPEHIDM